MKAKHLQIRIEQCLLLAKASNCPRRKFGAMLVDPVRNVVLMDAYNGGPRGSEGPMCGGHFCERDGLQKDDFDIQPGMEHDTCGALGHWAIGPGITKFFKESPERTSQQAAQEYAFHMVAKYPGVESGTHMEVGCHHSESNVICNAAASGVKTLGAMLIVTGEPCMMCAKLIHHAGIAEVVLVKGGYAGGREGVEYLTLHGVTCTEVAGPQDPRAGSAG